jgi:hypothetical protein
MAAMPADEAEALRSEALALTQRLAEAEEEKARALAQGLPARRVPCVRALTACRAAGEHPREAAQRN